jgi:hypothetical protein
MVSLHEVPSPTVPATPEQLPHNYSAPLAQKVHTNSSINFDDPPFTKMDMSPPLRVAPRKGNGQMQKPVSLTAASLYNDVRNAKMELASPIFAYRSQYPAIGGQASDDIMEGVEQTSTSGSEVANNNSSAEELVRVLLPTTDNLSQASVDLEQRIKIEWIGTSTLFLRHNLELQAAVSLS